MPLFLSGKIDKQVNMLVIDYEGNKQDDKMENKQRGQRGGKNFESSYKGSSL